MKLTILGTLLLGGIAALDATPVAQTLLSQPLATATLLGWVWGDWQVALKAGVVLQIIAVSAVPLGARTPEDYATGGVVGTGVALALASQQPFALARDACVLVGVAAGMLAAIGGVPVLKWQRRMNESLSRWCEAELARGTGGALAASHGAAVVLAFAAGVSFTALCLGAGLWMLEPLVAREWLKLSRAWSLSQPVWLGLGVAHVLQGFIERRPMRAALFGAALLAVWLALIVGAP